MRHYKKSIRVTSLILAITFIATLLTGCYKAPNPVDFITISKARLMVPPGNPFFEPQNPHPDSIQEVLSPGDQIYLNLYIYKENKEAITFSRYTYYNKRTGQEITLETPPGDLGPFQPGGNVLVAFRHPWAVPEQLDVYQLRVYLGNDVVASALFEVTKHEVIDSIGISKYILNETPSFGPIIPETPYPDFVQEMLNPGDKIYLGLVINEENKEAITFSRYSLFNEKTGQETVLETSNDLGSFQPGQLTLVAFDNPWTVPEQLGTYEVRIYIDNDIIASALFEVK